MKRVRAAQCFPKCLQRVTCLQIVYRGIYGLPHLLQQLNIAVRSSSSGHEVHRQGGVRISVQSETSVFLGCCDAPKIDFVGQFDTSRTGIPDGAMFPRHLQ